MTTLLAVDDSSTMRKVLDITFAGEDFTPVLAGNAREALSCLRESEATIALVDITLGADSGYDLCQQIKAAAPGTKVLLLSSKQNPYDVARGATAGADDHLDKPFDTQTLIDKVKALAVAAASQPPAHRAAAVVPAPVVAPIPAPPPAFGREPAREEVSSVVPAPAYQPAPMVTPQPAVQRVAAPVVPVDAAGLETRLAGLGLTTDQLRGVLALSKDAIEQAVWEVVPVLAESLIREEIQKLIRS